MDKRIHLSKKNKVFAGVCGGFAEYFNVDPTLVRIIWVLFSFLTQHIPAIIIYIICWAIIPSE